MDDGEAGKVQRVQACVFNAEEDFEALKAYYGVRNGSLLLCRRALAILETK